MDMSVGVLDHYNLSTRKLKETVQFYEDVLGFKNGPRPPFNFPGAWLYSAGHPVLHINDISQTDKPQRPDSGVIDHVAFGSRGFEAMKQASHRQGHRRTASTRCPTRRAGRFSSATPTTWRSSSISKPRTRWRSPMERKHHRGTSASSPPRIPVRPVRAADSDCGPWQLTKRGHHGEISSGELQDLPVGAARGDRAAREEHPVRVPPYRAGQPARLVPRHLAAQEGAGAAHRRHGVAVRVERDQRISRRDHRAAAASGRSGRSAPSTAPGPTMCRPSPST